MNPSDSEGLNKLTNSKKYETNSIVYTDQNLLVDILKC